jgi:hypothetical protein
MTVCQKKLLYIAGFARCGSTILGNVLGEINGFFNAGELMYIWDQALSKDGKCGCGLHVSRCEVWSSILDHAYPHKIDFGRLIRIRNRIWGAKFVLNNLRVPENKIISQPKIYNYLSALEHLYSSILADSSVNAISENIIIDTSKNPAYLYLLSMIRWIDLYVVHIVRDPRATAYSWIAKKKGFYDVSNTRSSLRWSARNLALDLQKKRFYPKFIQIRYEDFISDPKRILEDILKLVNERKSSLEFITPEGIIFHKNHCVFGNPDLFKRGAVKLKIDKRWNNMKAGDKFLTTLLTWPLMVRYGYPVFC